MTTNFVRAHEARLNITWSGENGDLMDPVAWDLDDAAVRQIAMEAVLSGNVPGLSVDVMVDFTDFVVDRFAATQEVPFNRLFLRPKTPFGAGGDGHGR